MATGTLDINTDPYWSGVTDLDMAFNCTSGWDITMASGSSTGHSDLHGSGCSMPLGGKVGHGFLTQTWATDQTTGPDTVLGSYLVCLGVTMVPGVCVGYPDWHGPSCSTALRQQHRPTWQPKPLESSWPLW